MAKAIVALRSGMKVGYANLGVHGDQRGSPRQQVHDGDTIIVDPTGNLSVRFLGVDTPEVSFPLPGRATFDAISSDGWAEFLTDPFRNAPSNFLNALPAKLRQHLDQAVGADCAANHAAHAEHAHHELEQLVINDMAVLGQDKENFQFFFAFANEVMDVYGRLLGFINRNQETETADNPRPFSYNERLLQTGLACPYFIWPNVNPFRRAASPSQAVPPAGDIDDIANGPSGLGAARSWIKQARDQEWGILDAQDPLKLEPFELRFLARQSPPSRWVIDLADINTRKLYPPTDYYKIPFTEDRLFIPEEYVPLFREQGWRLRN